MKIRMEATCRYGHGALTPFSFDPGAGPSRLLAPLIEDQHVKLGQGYEFNVYECPVCTYIELHDSEPVE